MKRFRTGVMGVVVFLGGFIFSSPAFGEKRPVVARVSLVFSMVSHYNHIDTRVEFYDEYGEPPGNENYAVPHLVYEPLITLYNPYNEELTIEGFRLRLRDVPVGFRFSKHTTSSRGEERLVWLRPEWAQGEFHGLARFQVANESDPEARKTFTVLLRGSDEQGKPGNGLKLDPGEVRSFAAYVGAQWNWEFETRNEYFGHAFADWEHPDNFTNVDPRFQEIGELGFQYVEGWSARAGFQSDHLSVSQRPYSTMYDFETGHHTNNGYVPIRMTEGIAVESRTQRAIPATIQTPDFSFQILAGEEVDPEQDLVRNYEFDIEDVAEPEDPVISREFQIGDILQEPDDMTPGGKTPFAQFTIAARAEALRSGAFYDPEVPASELYDTRFDAKSELRSGEYGPLAAVPDGVAVSNVERRGSSMFFDVTTPADGAPLRLMGTSDLSQGFPEDVTDQVTFTPGPVGTGLRKAAVDLDGIGGDHYFIRVER